MFPASFYQPPTYYRAPSPDHRRAVPFTIANIDSYDLFCTPSPQAYATAEASALDHLHTQAHLEALRARERELEKQRRLARLAALEEAQHREYHQRQVIDAYLQAQARAHAQAEAERQQRERQRQYLERARAIAQAQAVQREKAERARAAEIERRREEARQRIFVRDLVDSLFSDAQPQPQRQFIQPQQQPRAQPPTGYRVAQTQAQPRVIQPQVAQPQIARRVEPQTARLPQPAQPQRPAPQVARQPSPDPDQEAFERFLNSFFGVASPQISKPRAPVAESRPFVPVQEAKPRDAAKSVTFTQPEPAKPKALERPAPQPAAVKAPSNDETDDLTTLLSTVLGVPVNVKNVELKNNIASPPIIKAATPVQAQAPAEPTPRTASPIVRPPSPTPEKQRTPTAAKSPVGAEPEEEELSEDFKQMVDKVFKDLERVFGVPATEGETEGKKQEATRQSNVPETKENKVQPESKPEAAPEQSKPEAAAEQRTVPSSIETPAQQTEAPAPVESTPIEAPAPVPVPDYLEDPSEEQSTEISTEMLDDDDVPSSAAELQDAKAVDAATLIQQKYRKHHARVQRLEKLESLKAKLEKLVKGFTFPEHLDFQDPDSEHPTPSLDPVDGASHDGDERVTPVPPLSFSHNNAPYHAHAQALLSLLVAADAISSDGDKEVRSVRKAFVKDVEEKLAEMERQRSAVYRRQQAEKESTAGDGKVVTTEGAVTPTASTPSAKTDASAQQEKSDAAPQDAQPSSQSSQSQSEPADKTNTAEDATTDAPLAPEAVVVTDENVLTAPIEELVEPETPSESTAPKTNARPRPTVEDEEGPTGSSSHEDFVIVDK